MIYKYMIFLFFRNKICIQLFFVYLHSQFGSVAQLNRASDYGSEGFRFES